VRSGRLSSEKENLWRVKVRLDEKERGKKEEKKGTMLS